jgi:hypothetical protein
VFPGHDSKHQISVCNLFRVNDLTSFAFDTISAIASSFRNGALIDFAHRCKNDVVLMICGRITECTVGVFA